MRPIMLTILWGIYCACSWTWVIGMYLPRLMMERYGPWAFLVFAIPNVIGCAGMGYVLRSRQRSAQMTGTHAHASVIFSLAAIGYHLLFLPYFLALVRGDDAQSFEMASIGIVVGLYALAWGLSYLPTIGILLLGALVYVTSLAAWNLVGFGAWETITALPAQRPMDLALLAPVIALGFLACPYLDLTFHRARQDAPSKHAFGVFGITFLIMICFTPFLWFSGKATEPVGLMHIIAQCVFTMSIHLKEARRSPVLNCPKRRTVWLALPVVLAAAFPIARTLLAGSDQFVGENLYLRYMVLYGLVFPAYVLLVIGPGRAWPISLRSRSALAVVILLLSPLYELGFMHEITWPMLAPTGLAIIWVLSRSGMKRGLPSA
jgi:hypothetical protein